MTFNSQLDLIFNTLDSNILRQSIKDNYLVRREITSLIDHTKKKHILTYDPVKKAWLNDSLVIDTMSINVLFPFRITRLWHESKIMFSCDVDYVIKFNDKVNKIVDAYVLAMIPVDSQKKINQLELDIKLLETQERDALEEVKKVSIVADDMQLKSLNSEISTKNVSITNLNGLMNKLTALQNNASDTKLWGFFGKDEEKRAALVQELQTYHLYSDLKTTDGIKHTLILINAQLQNLNLEKDALEKQRDSLEQQNAMQKQNKELVALRNLSQITNKIVEIKSEIHKLQSIIGT